MLFWQRSQSERFYIVEKDGEDERVRVVVVPHQQQEGSEETFILFRSDGEILPVEVDDNARLELLKVKYVPFAKGSDGSPYNGSLEIYSATNPYKQRIVNVIKYIVMASRRDVPTTTLAEGDIETAEKSDSRNKDAGDQKEKDQEP